MAKVSALPPPQPFSRHSYPRTYASADLAATNAPEIAISADLGGGSKWKASGSNHRERVPPNSVAAKTLHSERTRQSWAFRRPYISLRAQDLPGSWKFSLCGFAETRNWHSGMCEHCIVSCCLTPIRVGHTLGTPSPSSMITRRLLEKNKGVHRPLGPRTLAVVPRFVYRLHAAPCG